MTDNCCEVPLIEKLRSVPKDYRTCVAIQWAEDGTETGHRFIPVGYMMHEAADALTAANERITNVLSMVDEANALAKRNGLALLAEREVSDKLVAALEMAKQILEGIDYLCPDEYQMVCAALAALAAIRKGEQA
jgi:hypothetical protein